MGKVSNKLEIKKSEIMPTERKPTLLYVQISSNDFFRESLSMTVTRRLPVTKHKRIKHFAFSSRLPSVFDFKSIHKRFYLFSYTNSPSGLLCALHVTTSECA